MLFSLESSDSTGAIVGGIIGGALAVGIFIIVLVVSIKLVIKLKSEKREGVQNDQGTYTKIISH